jgi:hypothetical protein
MSSRDEVDIYNYPLIELRRPQEMFVRTDKYTICRYWYDKEGIRQRENLFYPSKFGMEEIKPYIKRKQNQLSPSEMWLVKMYNRLYDEGKGDILKFNSGVKARIPLEPRPAKPSGRMKLNVPANDKPSGRMRLSVAEDVHTSGRMKLNTDKSSKRMKLNTSKRRKLNCKN